MWHSLVLGDAKGFWKNIHNDSVKKVTGNVLTVGDTSGVNNFASIWKMHFEKIHNCIDSVKEKAFFFIKTLVLMM